MVETKPVADFIYALYYELDGRIDYFYVGRSIDPQRRHREHILDAKSGATQDSREFIRNLTAVGIDFDHEILAEITSTDDKYEAYYVWEKRRQGYTLTNMREGDAEQIALEIEAEGALEGEITPYNFLQKRAEGIAAIEAKREAVKLAKKQRTKRDSDPERTLFSFEKPETRFVSKHVAELRERIRLERDIEAMDKAGYFGRKVDKKR